MAHASQAVAKRADVGPKTLNQRADRAPAKKLAGGGQHDDVLAQYARRQYVRWPPLIAMLAPVRNAASSLAR